MMMMMMAMMKLHQQQQHQIKCSKLDEKKIFYKTTRCDKVYEQAKLKKKIFLTFSLIIATPTQLAHETNRTKWSIALSVDNNEKALNKSNGKNTHGPIG